MTVTRATLFLPSCVFLQVFALQSNLPVRFASTFFPLVLPLIASSLAGSLCLRGCRRVIRRNSCGRKQLVRVNGETSTGRPTNRDSRKRKGKEDEEEEEEEEKEKKNDEGFGSIVLSLRYRFIPIKSNSAGIALQTAVCAIVCRSTADRSAKY